MTEKPDQPQRRRRRSADEPRTCAFVEESGERHGIVLTEENSFTNSSYCKEHHQVMVLRSRKTGPGRESNIARTKRYQQRHPEVAARLRQESRERKARGEAPTHPGRGRPAGQAAPQAPREKPPRPLRERKPRTCGFKLPDGSRHGILLDDENSYKNSRYCKEHHLVMVARAQGRAQEALPAAPRCYKPASSRRYHSYGETMSQCGQWRTPKDDPGYAELPLNDPRLCAACRRRLSTKDA